VAKNQVARLTIHERHKTGPDIDDILHAIHQCGQDVVEIKCGSDGLADFIQGGQSSSAALG
jgi:hypothetical protein